MERNWKAIAENLQSTLGTLRALGADDSTEIPSWVQDQIDAIQEELAEHW